MKFATRTKALDDDFYWDLRKKVEFPICGTMEDREQQIREDANLILEGQGSLLHWHEDSHFDGLLTSALAVLNTKKADTVFLVVNPEP